MFVIPNPLSINTVRSIFGRPNIGNNGFGVVKPSFAILEPIPAAKITAFTLVTSHKNLFNA